MFTFIKSIFIVILFLLIPSYSFSTNKIDINQATVEELEKLPGIGPKIAKNIVEYREKNGPFRSIEELLKVKGIGPKKLEQIKKYLKINKEKTNSPDISKEQEKSLEIYYYKDEKGIIHYTQFPETVPEKYKNSLKKLE
jgi:competence protein ComEA